MARQKKSKRRQRTTSLSPEHLLRQAEAHFANARYREAIEVYKRLLKLEPQPQWQEALANAYLARGRELAAKGMHKEAAALWENMAHLCDTREGLDEYFTWLIRAGRQLRAAKLFAEAEATFQQSEAGRQVASLLAGLLLTGHDELQETPLTNERLQEHYELMKTAVSAYCQGDDASFQEKLKRIPFRSPYKDLRLVLQALTLLEIDPDGAKTLLDKVPATSPFRRFAWIVGTATLRGPDLLKIISELEPPELALATTLRGLDENKIRLITELQGLATKKAEPRPLFRFALDHSSDLGETAARRFCLSVLPTYPEGIDGFQKRFGPLSDFERYRIAALNKEHRDDTPLAEKFWQRSVDFLLSKPERNNNRLAAALILRHLDKIIPSPPPSIFFGREEPMPALLLRSLELDPQDKQTYLDVLARLQQIGKKKEHDRWLEKAVQHLPEDSDILLAAATGAQRRGAFKKASRYVQTLLKRDPINHPARNLLISLHLAHARKQIETSKYALAEKELKTALQAAREDEQRGAVELLQGMLDLRRGHDKEAVALLATGYRHCGEGLDADLRVLVEGRRLRIKDAVVKKHHNQIQRAQRPEADKDEILRFFDLVNRYLADSVGFLADVVQPLSQPLKKATRLDFSEKELRTLCDTLNAIDNYPLLNAYANAALERKMDHPVFVFYQVRAKTHGNRNKLNIDDRARLMQALDAADDAEDYETYHRIDEYLGPLPGLGRLPRQLKNVLGQIMEETGNDELFDALDQLFGGDDDEIDDTPPKQGDFF